MEIEYIPIKSNTQTKVWFEFTLDEAKGELTFHHASYKGKNLDKVARKKLPYPTNQIAQDHLPAEHRKDWLIMCDLEGNIKVLPTDIVGGDWLAHLGFICPSENRIKLLKFQHE